MKFTFDKSNLEKASQMYADNQNFSYTVLPRLKVLYAIKKKFKSISDVEWFFEFDHVNINRNRVFIKFNSTKSEDFTFYYEIPLCQKFELRVFFAKSSIHFIDIYNYLINNNILLKNKYPLKAEYHTIPHLVINKNTKKYNVGILNQYTNSIDINQEIIDKDIKNEIANGFNIFNPVFNQILNQFKI